MTGASWLAFTPRDTVFVRDGRSFDAAADALAETVWPSPTTIAGAVGAALGIKPQDVRDSKARDEIRGPVLAKRDGDRWVPYFPVPADLVRDADGLVFRLTPQPPAGSTDLDGVPRWLMPPEDAEPAEPLRGWIPGHVLADYLAGRLADGVAQENLELVQDPLPPEPRVGLARDNRRVRDGYLYQMTHLRPHENWGFLAEYVPRSKPVPEPGNHCPFGGRGRLADVGSAAVSWPEAGPACKRVLVYLATPAIWDSGWRLPADGAELVAAATGEPMPAATSDPRDWRNTRALRWAVPAGSVYLLEFRDPAQGAEWAKRWHGAAFGRPENDLLRTAGFGVVLTGVWE